MCLEDTYDIKSGAQILQLSNFLVSHMFVVVGQSPRVPTTRATRVLREKKRKISSLDAKGHIMTPNLYSPWQ